MPVEHTIFFMHRVQSEAEVLACMRTVLEHNADRKSGCNINPSPKFVRYHGELWLKYESCNGSDKGMLSTQFLQAGDPGWFGSVVKPISVFSSGHSVSGPVNPTQIVAEFHRLIAIYRQLATPRAALVS
jgi:hypothetical protein